MDRFGQYVVRRLLQMVPVLVIMSMMVFALTVLLPGDPTITVLGEFAPVEQRERLRKEMGFDQPIPVQYVRWAGRALSGDLGQSLSTREPVSEMLANRVPVTLELSLLSIVLGVLIGVPAGTLAARWRNTWVDFVASFVAMAGLAMPFFWLGILLILMFALWLGWLPPSGYVPFLEDPVENLKLMLLPAITVGTALAALVMRQTRTAMLDVLSQDYIRTARAKGASEFRVVVRHGLRNALIPVVTVIGLQMGALLGGAVVTEIVFSMPGLGSMVIDSIFQRDFAVLQGAIIVIVVGVLVVNLLTDLTYVFLDRRIKL